VIVDITDSPPIANSPPTSPTTTIETPLVATTVDAPTNIPEVIAAPEKFDELEAFMGAAGGSDDSDSDGDVDLFKLLGDDRTPKAGGGADDESEDDDDDLLNVLKGVEDDSD
jgi:hypothetical protein